MADGGSGSLGLPDRPVSGVLLDIDETLVDLEGAMHRALREVTAGYVELDEAGWARFCDTFTRGSEDIYEQYVAGEITFAEQRVLRAQRCLADAGTEFPDAAAAASWLSAYEAAQPAYVRAFDDVVPLLDALDEAGVPYGAVSNNVHDYQRAKLDHAGLERVEVLVGIDAVGAAKPAPAIFHEGLRLLGTSAAGTVYVGDNPHHDVVGAEGAGLRGIWLNRSGKELPADLAAHVRVQIGSLEELPALIGLGATDPREAIWHRGADLVK
ncbi:HAD family hydrolase [Sinomonas humi]|uniref:HAD family hydrolase n=1 Tax=Sinomonas humi TaxID=1338436 RepID=UPI00068D553A|nr:HAD family hydrolase [Sinomonas humi]